MATPDTNVPVDSISLGSDEVYSLICLPCHREGITLLAFSYCKDCQEHLCQGCFKHHKRATRLKHHKIQDKDAMPSTQKLTDAPLYTGTGTTESITKPCPYHKTETIKFYCHSHDKLLCCICVAREHAEPCNVDYITDISDDTLNSLDYKHTMIRLNKLWNKCTTLKRETFRTADKSDKSLKDALQEIKKYRQDINKRINELQEELEAKIQALQHENNEKSQIIETICVDIMKTVKSMHDSIKQIEASKEVNQLFIEVKEAQKLLQDYERSMRSLSAGDSIAEYKFIPSKAINDVLQKEKMIGQISTKYPDRAGFSSQGNVQLPSADDSITPTCLGEIYVKTSEDSKICLISGMTLLPPDRLVLTDWENKSIKLNSNSITSELSLGTEDDDRPWSITATSSTQVAVTVPYRHHIQFISVSDKLSKIRTIQTEGYCMGICCHQDKLIVTYWNPGKLEILEMSGKIVTEVTTDSKDKDVFIKPAYVQANSKTIYVSDIVSKTVIMLNWNGEVTDRIAFFKGPRGLALLDDGSVLVCEKDSNGVSKMVSASYNSRLIVQDMSDPYALCVCDGGHKLYISRYTKNEYDNALLAYKI